MAINSGELVRPVEASLPQRDAIAIYTRRGASRRAATRALLAWLDERLEDDRLQA